MDETQKQPLRVVYLEDDPADRELIARGLSADGFNCEFTHTVSRKEFEDAIQQQPLDLILADHTLPAYDGLSALKTAQERRPEVPFILISGSIGEEQAVESLKAGATDYLIKGRTERIGPAVRRALREAEIRKAHHQAEINLRASEERFRSVWERSIDGMRLTDAEGQILAVNEAFCRLMRLPREKLEGHSFAVPYAEHSPANGIQVYQTRFATGGIKSRITSRVKLWNAEELDLEISSSFIQSGDDGKVLLSIFRDVTERVAAEERGAAFANLAQQMSAARSARAAAQIMLDVADELLAWDACTFDLYSPETNRVHHVLNADTIDGQKTNFSAQSDHEPPTPLAAKAITDGAQLLLRDQRDGMRPEGRPFGDTSRPSASLMFVPIRHGSDVIGVMSIQSYMPNAYDGKSLETLQALADHCAGAINRIRTEEALGTAQEELRQAQKMEAIGQLAGGVAHDFNNMLAVMRGNAELLLLSPAQHSEQTRDCLKQITAAAERAAKLTRQLLAFSRKQVMQAQPQDLNDLVANLSQMLTRAIGEHIRLECHYAARLPFVHADSGMIEQVLVNLVLNARDAMPAGGNLYLVTERVVLDDSHVRANPDARAGEFVCLTVRDTGSGIAKEHLPRIFEPFFTTKEIGKGTGLGLSTVYGIIKQHRGWIEVSSQVGTGTTFKIFLPATPAPPRPEPVQQVATATGGNELILLVEDDDGVRAITRRILANLGYKICEANSAKQALGIWSQHRDEIALLLSDVVMPGGISGRELSEQLRAEKPALKVILMSGYSAEIAGRDTMYFRRTNTFFLQKPCSSGVLGDAIRRCLDAKPESALLS
jgi:PAS domain S-box-containing protein